MIKTVVTALTATLFAGSAPSQNDRTAMQANRIAGAWRVLEITRDSAGTRKTSAYPGLYLFTGRHYSITRVDSNNRKEFPHRLRRTADTYLRVWGPLAAQAGTYQIEGGRLKARPYVAKNPSAMRRDNVATYTWRTVGDTLWLQIVGVPTGPVKNGMVVKLLRLER